MALKRNLDRFLYKGSQLLTPDETSDDELQLDFKRQKPNGPESPLPILQKEEDNVVELGVSASLSSSSSSNKKTRFMGIKLSELVYPKSMYQGWELPLPISSEKEALTALKIERQQQQSPHQSDIHSNAGFSSGQLEFELEDFTIYKPGDKSKLSDWPRLNEDFEMVPLHTLEVSRGTHDLVVDGFLIVGAQKRYIQAVPFKLLSVAGYDDLESHSVPDIWIQSRLGTTEDIWYKLKTPAPEYNRYYRPFLWLADLGKHFVDYLLRHPETQLSHFRHDFYNWTAIHHGRSDIFQQWLKQFGRLDFRGVVAAHHEYLWKEATSIDDHLRHCPLWGEIIPDALGAVQLQAPYTNSRNRTTVTPFIFECFKNMYFAEVLEPRGSALYSVLAAQRARKNALGFFTESYVQNSSPQSPSQDGRSLIKTGSVITILRDVETKWKGTADVWYAYVRRLSKDKKGVFLEVIWLYRPEDTTLSNMTYPYRNELFFSDNCNCGDAKIRLSDVKGTIEVKWSPHEAPISDYFVRQKYCVENHSFITLDDRDFECRCNDHVPSAFEIALSKYQIRDTVLIEQDGMLEPVVITDFLRESNVVQVRRLLRSKRDCRNLHSRPNELVWTDQFLEISAETIRRDCHIIFMSADDVSNGIIPRLYDRGGQGDFFYIVCRSLQHHGKLVIRPLPYGFPGPMKLGLEPCKSSQPKMNMLSLFSGGGNFDRGLEEGGAVQTKWVVEWDEKAVHSYRANLPDPRTTNIFYGSVDDFLARAIDGNTDDTVPGIGQVDSLVGGSPCQGLSAMQPNRLSLQSLTNTSKIASVAAYIDHYRPAYALLENVTSMTWKCGENKDQSVFSQMLCALVAMGYQVKQYIWDAWSSGAAQSRSRLFISVAAPCLVPMSPLRASHAHPDGKWNKALGRAANGEAFGSRQFDAAPFPFLTAKESTADLPPLGDGQVRTCIEYPDHRPTLRTRPLLRHMIHHIPKAPLMQNVVKATKADVLPLPVLRHLQSQNLLRQGENSKAFTRINPEGLFPTILTCLTPHDAITGYGVHWDQDRYITLMEARRAQGYPDEDVLIGHSAAQWKIVGNSVPRQMALTLGLSLREAWTSNPSEQIDRVLSRLPPITAPVSTAARSQNSLQIQSLEVIIDHSSSIDKSEYTDWRGLTPDDRGTADDMETDTLDIIYVASSESVDGGLARGAQSPGSDAESSSSSEHHHDESSAVTSIVTNRYRT
ncbi:S-adenosyl-L-methionine-dependent methyltransferase [Tothia fuscella]|uniref:DNA (cytosine-5-)-methyltransferase n=1 Tax=Tothia fuscella TaxID=1048955 RepID=A0A9P4P3W1_9PEZI|nr:S-adenosyl-L-methionine-dependent methyltransferase [Tothia fuscella]